MFHCARILLSPPLCGLFASLALWGQASPAKLKREHFQNADVTYAWAQDSVGHKLRTFVTRPKNAPPKLAAIFFSRLAELRQRRVSGRRNRRIWRHPAAPY